jgi:ribosomal protein S18 acetylase RimI-like enzyme
MRASLRLRTGSSTDAASIAALATLVFLDTYATHGVRPDLAREAFHGYSQQAFLARLAESQRRFIVAEDDGLVGFAELLCSNLSSPVVPVWGGELVRLYVQPRAQRGGIGRALIREVEKLGSASWLPSIWLSVWEDNAGALEFYRQVGYAEVGTTTYSFEGNSYGNRVLSKVLVAT